MLGLSSGELVLMGRLRVAKVNGLVLRMGHTDAVVKVVIVVVLFKDLRTILAGCRVIIWSKVVIDVRLI